MPNPSLTVKFGTEKHRFIAEAARSRIQFAKSKHDDLHEKWQDAEDKMLAYMPERENDRLRRVERDAGKPNYTTLSIPYSYGVMMAAHTYWTTVFLSRSPVLQFTARHGEGQQSVQALEALMDYQVQQAGMMVPWYIWLQDVGKYGVGIIGEFWEDREEFITTIEEIPKQVFGLPVGGTEKRKRTRRVPTYSGNRSYNVRPYDFLPDPRVPMNRFQEGEFCAVYVELGWNDIKRREAQGIYMNVDQLKRHRVTRSRDAGSTALDMPIEDEFADSIGPSARSQDMKSSDVIPLYELHVELIPNEWELGTSEFPEKWVITVDTTYKVVIGVQPLGALHNKFPFSVLELEPEGYGISSRGIPEINQDIQHVIDWLVNSHFYNVRKALNNQVIVDPSRLVMQDVMDPLPGGVWRVKPEAYGQDVRTMMQQVPVVDVTQNHLRDTQFMIEMSQRALGINDSIMGMVSAGGSSRKTATEVRTSSTFGINRLKTAAEFFSAQGWAPMSQRMVQNSQQYFDQNTKLRVVGDLAQTMSPTFLDVSPETIIGFYDFVPVDGTLPVDRFAQANLWRELMAQMRNFPDLMAQYDMSKIFAWVAQLAGLKNINQFRIEIAPDAQLAAQAQQGNVVPIETAGGGDLANVPEPGQVSGLGTTG